MSIYTFLSLVTDVLKVADQPLTANQIWGLAIKMGLDKHLRSAPGKTPEATVGAQLYTSINKGNSIFMQASKRPATFWLSSRLQELQALDSFKQLEIVEEIKDDKTQIEEEDYDSNQAKAKQERKNEKAGFFERDLHPLLAKYLRESSLSLYSKTIFHEKSQRGKSGENEWIHPDMVGIYFPFKQYAMQTLELMKNFSRASCMIYSFEIKKDLSFSNLRESYFQAVSNSSWAHEGYLVAFNIEDEVLEEVERLRSAFGIGLIKLNIDSIKILIHSKSKETLDIKTLDLLVDKNTDFKKFVDDLNKDISGARVFEKNYDGILDDEELEEYIKLKNIIEGQMTQ